MKKSTLLLSAVVAVALALVAGPAAASTKTSTTGGSSATVTVVHGIPNLLVDVYVVNNFQRTRLDDVPFTTVKALTLRPGFAYIAILPADDSKFSKPLYQKFLWLKGGENLSVAAHLNAAGTAPVFSVFKNTVSNPGPGNARVVVRHLAAAPPVDILAGAAEAGPFSAVIEDLTNPNEKAIVVPGGSYWISVAPANTITPVFGPANLTFAAGTTTIVYAVGSVYSVPVTFTPLVQVF